MLDLGFSFKTQNPNIMKNTDILKILLTMILSLLMSFYSKAQVNGNGNIETRSFELESFDRIQLNIPVVLEVEVGEEQSIEITTDSNIFRDMKIESSRGRFYVDQAKWIRPTKKNE